MFGGAGAPAGFKKLTFEHVNFSVSLTGVLVQGEVRSKRRKHWSMKEANRQCFTLLFLGDLKLLRLLDYKYYTLKT